MTFKNLVQTQYVRSIDKCTDLKKEFFIKLKQYNRITAHGYSNYKYIYKTEREINILLRVIMRSTLRNNKHSQKLACFEK